ncbi:MAG: thioredoxin domain-containing protein, partial [Myxococcota bacterium]|nr:thioredoxin domain-containing protein [Myxococcota bacterium]
MKRPVVVALVAVVAILAFVGGAGAAHADRLQFDPASVYKVPRGTGPSDGPADAPITIVEWSDFACGYCVRVQTTLDALNRLYPGQLRTVRRTLPLDDDNTLTAEAALAAAAQGKFRPMSDRMYALHGRVDRAGVELIARELGLDMLRFRADLDTRAHRAQIDADIKDAMTLGVAGTPAFFINGRPIHGNQSLRVFVEVVDQELARAAKVSGGYDALVAAGKPAADTRDVERTPFELDPNATYKMGLGLPGHAAGPDDALVTIVVWGDFECPYCARMAPVVERARQKYGNDVRVTYRHLAMAFHRKASLAAEAAVAAAEQGKFWAFHDALYGNFGALDRADLERFGQAAGLDMPKLRAALDDRRYRDLVLAEGAAAEALGVDGTPTLFINGKPVVGSRDSETLEKLVDEHLAQARASVRGGIAARDYYAVVMSGALGEDRADPTGVPDAT